MEDTIGKDEFLYRGIHEIWITKEDNNRISSAAFKQASGCSVDRDGGRKKEDCISRLLGLKDFGAVCRIVNYEVSQSGAVSVYCPSKTNIYHTEIRDSPEKIEISSNKKLHYLVQHSEIVFVKT